MSDIVNRSGTSFVYELRPEEKYCFFTRHSSGEPMLLITHPQRPPKVVQPDGAEIPIPADGWLR